MNLVKTLSISAYLGMIILFIGIILHLNHSSYSLYFLFTGVVPIISGRLYNFINGKTLNKRINSILLISSIFLLGAAVAAFLTYDFWIVLVMISAMLDFYISFRKTN